MLAILGGEPLRKKKWPIWPPSDERIKDNLVDVIESNRWTIRGWYTGKKSLQSQFSSRFAKFNQTKHCVLVNSGSSALQIALEALDVGYGDEVIVPIYTWIATAIAVLNVNATPVFVDADPITGCINPQEIVEKITPRTKVIIPVHLHSSLADMEAIMDIAHRYNLYVIEDCAQAHGARYHEQFVGSIGHLGAFSMNQEKILPCGEGGAVITNDDDLLNRLCRLRADGSAEKYEEPSIGDYELVDTPGLMGSNYCLSDFQAAVLLAELDYVEERNRLRERNAKYLDKNLSQLCGLMPIRSSNGTTARTYFKYAIMRSEESFSTINISLLCQALSAELNFQIEQTECQPLHKNFLYCPETKQKHHLNKTYMKKLDLSNKRFPIAEAHYENTFVFHHRILLSTEEDMDDIVKAFVKVNQYHRQLIK